MGVRLTAVVSCACGLLAGASAQSSPESNRTNNLTSLLGNRYDPWENPALGPHAPQSPGDPDLGEQLILTEFENYRPFNFQFAERLIWTDNAALSDGNELSDLYSNTELRLRFLPQIGNNTYAQVSANYQFFRYADHSSLDFDSLEASLGAIHVLRDLNDLSVWLRYNHTRLMEAGAGSELFTDHSIEFGLYLPITLGQRHSAYAAYTSEFSLDTDPGYAQRNDHGVTLGYNFSPTDRLQVEAYYRLELQDYRQRGRDDILQTAGLALTTRVTENIDLVLSASYSMNDSDLPGGDYEVGNLGAILSLQFEF